MTTMRHILPTATGRHKKNSCENIHPIALTSLAIRFALNPNRFRLLR